MKFNHRFLVKIIKYGLLLMSGLSISSFAGLFDFGGESWQEEVLLHDGRTIIVDRTVSRGGRHEVGQEPPIKEQSLTFNMPDTNESVVWEDKFSEDVGGANFLPMQLEIKQRSAYLVVYPMGCLSYNKWGRPNPPYVVFNYKDRVWRRIILEDLPVEFEKPNLIFSSPDLEAKKSGGRIVSAEAIKNIYGRYKQPEHKTIIREPLSNERVNEMCEERVLYKGYWVLPVDPVARKMIDQKKK